MFVFAIEIYIYIYIYIVHCNSGILVTNIHVDNPYGTIPECILI